MTDCPRDSFQNAAAKQLKKASLLQAGFFDFEGSFY
jgi:hypothetical protein